MLTTIEAEIDVNGRVTFLEPLKISKKSRAIITLLDSEQPKRDKSRKSENNETEKDAKTRQLDWLKANRDKFAGKYVALDGDVLLASAETMREIKEQTKNLAAENIFIVKVFAEETTVSAGL
jgi:hypothetical protein